MCMNGSHIRLPGGWVHQFYPLYMRRATLAARQQRLGGRLLATAVVLTSLAWLLPDRRAAGWGALQTSYCQLEVPTNSLRLSWGAEQHPQSCHPKGHWFRALLCLVGWGAITTAGQHPGSDREAVDQGRRLLSAKEA